MSEVLEQGPLAPPVRQSSRELVVLRVVLALVFVLGWVNAAAAPEQRSVEDLLRQLDAGQVTSVVIGRPDLPPDAEGEGQQRVEWRGPGGNGYAYYEYSTMAAEPFDDGERILDAVEDSPSPVDLETRADYYGPEGFRWNYTGLAILAALALLVIGPQPRLGTKWAWFWMTCAVPPLWLVFLILEPVPVWQRAPAAPRPRRLTGGWAFLFAMILGPMLAQLIPGFEVFPGR